MRYAVINTATNLVENVVVIDAGDGSQDLPGHIHVQSDTANIGDGWNGMAIVPQTHTPTPPRS
jgi:hypothetical protein